MISEVPYPINFFPRALIYDVQIICKIFKPSMTLFWNVTYLISARYPIVSHAKGILKVLPFSSATFEVRLLYITAPLCKLKERMTLGEKKYVGKRSFV